MSAAAMRWPLYVLLTVLLVSAGIGLYDRLELRSERVYVGPRGEAAHNPLLAAQRLLERQRVPVTSVATLADLPWPPATDAVLILPGEHTTLGKTRAAELLAWVEQGGRLLVQPRFTEVDEAPPADALLDPLQLNGVRFEAEQEHITLLIDEFPSAAPLALELPADRWVDWHEIEPDGVLWHEDMPVMLRLHRGAGYLLVLSDMQWFETDQIDELDHAELFWWLSDANTAPSRVWLVYQDDFPPLWYLLWKSAAPVILSLALLLLVWLLSSAQRFGPLLLPPPAARRSLLEHLAAAGELYWRGGRRDLLLEGARAALLRRIEHSHPELAVLDGEARIPRLATLTGLDEAAVRTALTTVDARRGEDFVQIVKTLQALREKL